MAAVILAPKIETIEDWLGVKDICHYVDPERSIDIALCGADVKDAEWYSNSGIPMCPECLARVFHGESLF